MTSEEKHRIYREFQETFPLENLKNLTLDQYTNDNRSDAFVYWLEFKTMDLGSIAGGSAYKFGIFRYNKIPSDSTNRTMHDNKHAWYVMLGKTAEEAFAKVKESVCKIAEYARRGDYDAIESIEEFGDVVKWKIAFMYSNETLIAIYNLERLQYIAHELGMENSENATIAQIQRFLISRRKDEDIFDYGMTLHKLWDDYKLNNASTTDNSTIWLWNGSYRFDKDNVIRCGESLVNGIDIFNEVDLKTYLTKCNETGNNHPTMNESYWKFVHSIKIGDLIAVFEPFNNPDRTKNSHLVRYGRIVGECSKVVGYADKFERQIEWIHSFDTKPILDYGDYLFFKAAKRDIKNKIMKLIKDEEVHEILKTGKTMITQYDSYIKLLKASKNLILTGAPGTGKTYITTTLAVLLCAPERYTTDHNELKKVYKELQAEGRIGFTTFHQSMDYEDFVEGLKPDTSSEEMRFELKKGIFRQMCDNASKTENDNFDSCYAKLVAELSEKEDMEVLSSKGTIFHVALNSRGNLQLLTTASKNNNGVLTKERIKSVYDGSNPDQYWMNYYVGVIEKLKKDYGLQDKVSNNQNNKPYVLIIDEINRANISKVLGELITLLEPTKRLGEDDEFTVTLPYSGETFGVPSNLYIIGTMNTADRSLGYIDYAIRRRFAFKSLITSTTALIDFYGKETELMFKERDLMQSVRKLIQDNRNKDFSIDDVMIGHSYFMAKDEEEYDFNLKYKIKPLLEEYLRDGILVEKGTEVKDAIIGLE